MCKNYSCQECPSFDGTCKLLKARLMKVLYSKILFRRFYNNIKKKLNIAKISLYNLKIDIFTTIFNITLEIKTIIKMRFKERLETEYSFLDL